MVRIAFLHHTKLPLWPSVFSAPSLLFVTLSERFLRAEGLGSSFSLVLFLMLRLALFFRILAL